MSQMSSVLQVSNGIQARFIDPSEKVRLIGALTVAGVEAPGRGVGNHELLLALVKDRDAYDPLKIQLTVLGQLNRFIGSWATTAVMIIGMGLLLRQVVSRGLQIADFLKRVGSFLPFMTGFVAGGATGFAAGRLLDEDEDRARSTAMSVAGTALEGFFYGLMPLAVGSGLRALVNSIGSLFGGAAPAATPASPVLPAIPGIGGGLGNVGQQIISGIGSRVRGALGNVWRRITGQSDSELSQSDYDIFADAVGAPVDEVKDTIDNMIDFRGG